MTNRSLCVVVLTSLFFSSGPPRASSSVSGIMMTEDQAISAVRAHRENVPNAGFVVALKVLPTPETQRVAQESLAEARSKQLTLYENGLFVNLLRAGGYLVLEFDKKTGAANKLYLATLNSTGEYVVHSSGIHGELTKDEAQTIIDRSANFSKAFFDSSVSPMKELLVTFGGPEAAAVGISDGQGYLAVPENVKNLSTGPGELLELTSLANGIALWTIRHALEMPIYAANPIAAVQQANKKLSELSQELRGDTGKKNELDSVDRLLDFDRIRSHEELEARLKSLRELSSFLDERSPLQVNSGAYKANTSISTVPLDLLVERDTAQFYGATTLPGLMSGWRHEKNVGLVLMGLSVAE
jgi:hypothetical protein